MYVLCLGLLIFLGVHSTRIVADGWRTQWIERHGLVKWRLVYSLVAFTGFALLVWGYGLARQQPVWLWIAPQGMRHVAALLTLPAFVLLAATYVPGNRIKASVGHPMLLAVKLWALAHLLANGSLADALLFGGFLWWAVWCFRAARRRDRSQPVNPQRGSLGATLLALGAGMAAWLVFVLWLHGLLIGVRPFG